MTGLVTLARAPIARPRQESQGIPEMDVDGNPAAWSHRQAEGLRFERWRAERGDFDGDRFGLAPEPMPPIVRELDR